jgi:predicted transposase YbfD/YdcC
MPYWVLDVSFREDDSRVRHRTAARNLVAGDRSPQTCLRGRCKKTAWNDDRMLRIIVCQVHA